MQYFYGSATDTSFAVYLRDGRYYPVFAERYGSERVSLEGPAPIIDPETVYALDKYMHPYEEGKKRIYMAGPLFNEGDRYTNQRNSDALRERGYTTSWGRKVV